MNNSSIPFNSVEEIFNETRIIICLFNELK